MVAGQIPIADGLGRRVHQNAQRFLLLPGRADQFPPDPGDHGRWHGTVMFRQPAP